MSIIEDVDYISARLKELEAAKASALAGHEYAVGGPIEVPDQVRHEFYSMYGFGYQGDSGDEAKVTPYKECVPRFQNVVINFRGDVAALDSLRLQAAVRRATQAAIQGARGAV